MHPFFSSELNDSTGSTARDTKPVVPVPTKEKTPSTPPKSKVQPEPTAPSTATNTGRSSLNDAPTKSVDESASKTQNDTQENNDSGEEVFENESHILEPSKSPPPPPVEKKPSAELRKLFFFLNYHLPTFIDFC
jgi:hypothetical protein